MWERQGATHRISIIATVLAIASCYGALLAIAFLSLLGVTVSADDRAWARGAVVLFAALAAVTALASSVFRRRILPAALSIGGFLLTTWATYGFRSRLIEASGFALLIAAVAWERIWKRRSPASPIDVGCAVRPASQAVARPR